MAKIFISYSTKEPDTTIARSFSDIFEKWGFETFFAGKHLRIGDNWSWRIDEALNKCDYFIVLLSERSLLSDMVTEEVRKAKELHDTQTGKPVIMPIKVNLPPSFKLNYDIAGYLNRIQHRFWHNENDTYAIAQEVRDIILFKKITSKVEPDDTDDNVAVAQSDMPVPNAPLEIPGGSVQLQSPYYISRAGENEFIQRILQPGALLRIKGPRQFGKTSLLSRIADFARQNGHKVITMSLQQLHSSNISDVNNLLLQICNNTTRRLGMTNMTKQWWNDENMDVKMKGSSYFEEYLLAETPVPIVLALDEADRIMEYPEASNEFFSMLRSWHEDSKSYPIWQRLKVAISYSTESYMAITDINQSPFNVGVESNLREFSREEVIRLAMMHRLHLLPLQVTQLMEMIGGHPYLVRVALYALASGEYSFEKFMIQAANDDGPYSDHLRRHHWNLMRSKLLTDVMRDIVTRQWSDNTLICNKLRAAGLILGTTPNVRPSFKLYDIYFRNKL